MSGCTVIVGCNISLHDFSGHIEMTSRLYLRIVCRGSPVLWVYIKWSTFTDSHSPWSLANTLTELFKISVVTQLKGGEKEDFELS